MGEATPIGEDGSCPSPLLIPSANHTFCSFAQRADVGRHYISFGGRSGLRENPEKLNQRQLFFTRYFQTNWSSPLFAPLFRSEAYLKATKDTCGGRDALDPIGVGIILALPGQLVPVHIDTPLYWGRTRYNLP